MKVDLLSQTKMNEDIVFLQNLFDKFVPARISHDNASGKTSKRPIFTGWLNITAEESVELARRADYKDGPFIFLTGKTTNYVTVDLDRKDTSRNDHIDKLDWVAYYTRHFGDPTCYNTLLIGTPSGGSHLVYKYEDGIQSGQLEKDVLVDILSDRLYVYYQLL